jgi:rhodanese-related sulfurtransferase
MAKTISKEELKKKFDNKENFKLIEVLEAPSYEKSHIKGAINIPLAHLGKEASDRFKKDDELIVYCADFECTASPKAADKLESIGFSNVRDFAGGKKEWKEAGYPMEEGKS